MTHFGEITELPGKIQMTHKKSDQSVKLDHQALETKDLTLTTYRIETLLVNGTLNQYGSRALITDLTLLTYYVLRTRMNEQLFSWVVMLLRYRKLASIFYWQKQMFQEDPDFT